MIDGKNYAWKLLFFSFYEKKFETADKWDLKLKIADDHKEALNWMVTENHPR